jgi:predicted RNA-binding Zn-ribbon protein involved in translation (DUF1610 family)
MAAEKALKLETKPRVCLRCNKTFASTGPGNRICPPCGQVNVGKAETSVSKTKYKTSHLRD